jgi:hypothetical protein
MIKITGFAPDARRLPLSFATEVIVTRAGRFRPAPPHRSAIDGWVRVIAFRLVIDRTSGAGEITRSNSSIAHATTDWTESFGKASERAASRTASCPIHLPTEWLATPSVRSFATSANNQFLRSVRQRGSARPPPPAPTARQLPVQIASSSTNCRRSFCVYLNDCRVQID